MRTIRVEVTADDIKSGVPRDREYCPVARAIARSLPGRCVWVGRGIVLIMPRDDSKIRIDSPASVSAFVRDFDDEFSVQPFAFDLGIPDEAEVPSP